MGIVAGSFIYRKLNLCPLIQTNGIREIAIIDRFICSDLLSIVNLFVVSICIYYYTIILFIMMIRYASYARMMEKFGLLYRCIIHRMNKYICTSTIYSDKYIYEYITDYNYTRICVHSLLGQVCAPFAISTITIYCKNINNNDMYFCNFAIDHDHLYCMPYLYKCVVVSFIGSISVLQMILPLVILIAQDLRYVLMLCTSI